MSEIVIYTAEKCPKCNVLKIKLNSKNVKFEEKKATPEEIDSILKNKNLMSLPILKIGEEYLDFTEANNWINNQK